MVSDAYFEERPRVADKPVRGTLSVERARKALGFVPKWPLETGYLRYCEWYVNEWEKAAGVSREARRVVGL